MQRSCAVCGRAFTARNSRAKFCGPTCRSKNHRGATVTDISATDRVLPTVLGATTDALEAAGVLDTPTAAAALVIAAKLDHGGDTGSATAALVRELRATIAEAVAVSTVAVDPVDELRKQREKRQARAGA